MARVKIDILRFSKLKCSWRGKFNSDEHYIYYCRQESCRRNGLTPRVNKSLKCSSVQSSLVTQSCLTLWDPMDARLPCPSIMPTAYSDSGWLSWWCHPTISLSVIPFTSSLQPFQLQGVFKWVSSSHQVAKVLEFQFQHHSCQWIFRTDFP